MLAGRRHRRRLANGLEVLLLEVPDASRPGFEASAPLIPEQTKASHVTLVYISSRNDTG